MVEFLPQCSSLKKFQAGPCFFKYKLLLKGYIVDFK